MICHVLKFLEIFFEKIFIKDSLKEYFLIKFSHHFYINKLKWPKHGQSVNDMIIIIKLIVLVYHNDIEWNIVL